MIPPNRPEVDAGTALQFAVDDIGPELLSTGARQLLLRRMLPTVSRFQSVSLGGASLSVFVR